MIAKYRGFTIDTKREVKGCLIQSNGRAFIIPFEWLKDPTRTASPLSNHEIIADWVEVSPESVGQFTGLHDKKRTKEYPEGQEIYGDFDNKGGDWIKATWHNGMKSEGYIDFYKGAFRVIGRDGSFDYLHKLDTKRYVEVIGNATEHPSLLKGEQE